MSVVRRGAVSAGVLAAAVLLGGPAAAQESDPCAPGPDGEVPVMCQSGPAQGSDTGTVGMEPDPCPPQPVEEGDGMIGDSGDQGVAEGEPAPGTEPGQDVPEGEPKPEPAEPTEPGSEEPDPSLVDPVLEDDPEQDRVLCAFAVPISAPVGTESAAGGATAARGQLPRTGPYDRLLALTAIGSGLVLVGTGAAVAGRRRTSRV